MNYFAESLRFNDFELMLISRSLRKERLSLEDRIIQDISILERSHLKHEINKLKSLEEQIEESRAILDAKLATL